MRKATCGQPGHVATEPKFFYLEQSLFLSKAGDLPKVNFDFLGASVRLMLVMRICFASTS